MENLLSIEARSSDLPVFLVPVHSYDMLVTEPVNSSLPRAVAADRTGNGVTGLVDQVFA